MAKHENQPWRQLNDGVCNNAAINSLALWRNQAAAASSISGGNNIMAAASRMASAA